MTIYLTTFGGKEQGKNRHNVAHNIHRDYAREAGRLFESAQHYGITNYLYFDDDWLKTTSEYKNNQVFTQPSFGWAFKPVTIWYALNQIEDGDSLLWVDTNHIFVNNPQRLVDYAREHNIFTHDHFPAFYPCKCFTFKDMFIGMECDEERYWECPQMQVNEICFHKNDFVIDFVEQWKDFACDYNVMIANKEPNFPCFYDHRHEQSIFSLLVEKYKIPYQKDPLDIIVELMGIDTEE